MPNFIERDVINIKLHYIKNEIENIKLPIVPSEYKIKSGKNSTSVNLLGFGEILDSGTPLLRTWNISSIFPAKKYSICTTTPKSNPFDYVSLINRLKDDNIICTYVITKTNINIPCTVEDFEYGEDDGSGDIYYTITFKEHKEITLTTISNVNTNTYLYFRADATLDVSKNGGYKVKEGDTLLNIAKLLYNDSSRYEELMTKNGLVNVNDIRVGMVLQQ